MWNGIAEWLGIDSDEDLDWILPNRQKFGSSLFNGHDLFTDSPVWTAAPTGPTHSPTNYPTPVPTNPIPTASPTTNSPTKITSSSTLTVVFTGSGDPPTPLEECQGDCENDSHCAGNLVCFHRSGNESVPGCTGSATSGTDFCAVRATANTAWLKGDNGSPAENFPLGLCEGDCDRDSNCQPGLMW